MRVLVTNKGILGVAVAAATGIAIVLSACSGGGGDAPPSEPLDPQTGSTASTGSGEDSGTTPAQTSDASSGQDSVAASDETPPSTTPATPAEDAGEQAPAPQASSDAQAADDGEPSDAGEQANSEETATEQAPPAAVDLAMLHIVADDIPQPELAAAVADVPVRPSEFAAYGLVALPWLQGQTSVAAIIPIFEAWGMPSVAGGSRLNLVDTNGDARAPDDGLSTLVIIYTDPASFGASQVRSNLVVYEPLPNEPGRFRLAYDHNYIQATLGGLPASHNIVVTRVDDVTGDELRDISFQETVCDDAGCQTVSYVLTIDGDGYLRTTTAFGS